MILGEFPPCSDSHTNTFSIWTTVCALELGKLQPCRLSGGRGWVHSHTDGVSGHGPGTRGGAEHGVEMGSGLCSLEVNSSDTSCNTRTGCPQLPLWAVLLGAGLVVAAPKPAAVVGPSVWTVGVPSLGGSETGRWRSSVNPWLGTHLIWAVCCDFGARTQPRLHPAGPILNLLAVLRKCQDPILISLTEVSLWCRPAPFVRLRPPHAFIPVQSVQEAL